MFSRQQKPNETVDSYLTDLYKLFSGTDFSDNHKQIIFIKGLKPSLRDFTITSRPNTLLEAIQTAKLKESLMGEQTNDDSTTLNVISKSQEPSERDEMKTMIIAVTKMFDRMSNFIENSNQQNTINNQIPSQKILAKITKLDVFIVRT